MSRVDRYWTANLVHVFHLHEGFAFFKSVLYKQLYTLLAPLVETVQSGGHDGQIGNINAHSLGEASQYLLQLKETFKTGKGIFSLVYIAYNVHT